MPNIGFPHNMERPPKSPAARRGDANLRTRKDTSAYILDPDEDFTRPYLAVPQGKAFLWPLGTQGFEISDQAELGRHKYLGGRGLAVDVTHLGENQIVLNGIFPGWTSAANMRWLRDIFYAESPASGKILSIPGVFKDLQYVVCDRASFTHAEDERTQDIAYSLTMLRVDQTVARAAQGGTGTTGGGAVGSSPANPPAQPGGLSGASHIYTHAGYDTLRKIANFLFGSGGEWSRLYNQPDNKKWFDSQGIASHQAPDYAIPYGIRIYY